MNAYFQAWNIAIKTDEELIKTVESKLDCCGSGVYENNTIDIHPTAEDHQWSMNRTVFDKTDKDCYTEPGNATVIPPNCKTCIYHVQPKMTKAFRGAGGLGLFFSFPEVITSISNFSCVSEFNIMTCYQF